MYTCDKIQRRFQCAIYRGLGLRSLGIQMPLLARAQACVRGEQTRDLLLKAREREVTWEQEDIVTYHILIINGASHKSKQA